MKKLIFVILLSFSLSCQAQRSATSTGEYPVYCEVMGWNVWSFGKMKVRLDFGSGHNTLCDSSGKMMKFESIISVLNFMGKRGWRCIDIYEVSGVSSGLVNCFLLEKWVKSDEEIRSGLDLKEEPKKEPYKPGKYGDDMY